MGKTAQANELAKVMDSCSKKNQELLAQVAKFDSAAIKACDIPHHLGMRMCLYV
jgi:hypothetical protein